MKMQRFIGDFDLSQPRILIEDDALVNQIFRVFRLKKGNSLILCDGNGSEAEAIIDSTGKKLELVILNRKDETRDLIERVLLCSVLKKENFELVCQKATELGIDRIIPVISERTVKLDIKFDRLIKIIKEATEQSGRLYMPKLENPIDFKDAIKMDFKTKLFMSLGGDQLIQSDLKDSRAVLVGPEGGWSDEEEKIAKENGWHFIKVNKNILRGETAAIIGSNIII